jgi:hypothetical protein
MAFQVTTYRVVFGTTEKITQRFPTLAAAETFAATTTGTAVIRNQGGTVVEHWLNGAKTTATVF